MKTTMLSDLIWQLTIGHPLPWVIDQDWTYEVLDADRKLVCKFIWWDDAAEFIRLAEGMRRV